jgi:heme-degrading monooxygenase HmoA
VYVWAYRVLSDDVEEFCNLYGVDGEWVKLFRRARGYVSTELYRDRKETGRFLTIDRWDSAEAYRQFRGEYAEQFKALDEKGGQFTQEETPLGELGPV